MLFGYELELKNRFLRIGQEYGTPTAKGISDLHRPDVGINVGINVGLNDTELKAKTVLLASPKTTIPALAIVLEVTERQAQRIIAALKSKAGLRRCGSKKSGEWCFECLPQDT